MGKKLDNRVEIIADLPLIGFGLPTSEGQKVKVSEELASEIVDAKYGRYADDKVSELKEKALKEQNAELQAKVSSLEAANAELQAKIAELQKPVE